MTATLYKISLIVHLACKCWDSVQGQRRQCQLIFSREFVNSQTGSGLMSTRRQNKTILHIDIRRLFPSCWKRKRNWQAFVGTFVFKNKQFPLMASMFILIASTLRWTFSCEKVPWRKSSFFCWCSQRLLKESVVYRSRGRRSGSWFNRFALLIKWERADVFSPLQVEEMRPTSRLIAICFLSWPSVSLNADLSFPCWRRMNRSFLSRCRERKSRIVWQDDPGRKIALMSNSFVIKSEQTISTKSISSLNDTWHSHRERSLSTWMNIALLPFRPLFSIRKTISRQQIEWLLQWRFLFSQWIQSTRQAASEISTLPINRNSVPMRRGI